MANKTSISQDSRRMAHNTNDLRERWELRVSEGYKAYKLQFEQYLQTKIVDDVIERPDILVRQLETQLRDIQGLPDAWGLHRDIGELREKIEASKARVNRDRQHYEEQKAFALMEQCKRRITHHKQALTMIKALYLRLADIKHGIGIRDANDNTRNLSRMVDIGILECVYDKTRQALVIYADGTEVYTVDADRVNDV